MNRKLFFLMFMGLFLFMGVGCCPLTKLNISVALDKSFQDKFGTNRDVQVDVVGVKEIEDARWSEYPMSKYWESANGQRNTPMRKTLTFNSKSLDPQVIWSNDPIWDTWLAGSDAKHPPKIYVLVQLPGTWSEKDDKPGSQDPRRQFISTKSCENKPGSTIRLVITFDHISMQ
jgi:hypothetical protein